MLECSHHMALDAALGDAQARGDVGMREPLDVVEHEDLPGLRRKALNARYECFEAIPPVLDLVGGGRLVGDLLDAFAFELGGPIRAAALAPPVAVDGGGP